MNEVNNIIDEYKAGLITLTGLIAKLATESANSQEDCWREIREGDTNE